MHILFEFRKLLDVFTSPPNDLLTLADENGQDVELDPNILDPDPCKTDGCFYASSPDSMLLTLTEQNQKMSTIDDEPGLNVRLRPRKSVASPQKFKTVRKSEPKISQDKTERNTTPSEVSPKKQDDLVNKSDLPSTPQFLCPYCDNTFGSKQTVAKHVHRTHLTSPKTSTSFQCIFCTHTEADSTIIQHMADTHPNQYFACVGCHTRFQLPSELAEHKLNVCAKLKDTYRNRLRKKEPSGKKTEKKKKKRQKDFNPELDKSDKEFQDGHGFNGIVISCEVKPSQEHDNADIEDKITTNLIVPHSKALAQGSGLNKGTVIVLDDIQWNKRIPPNFSFNNTDADQILSRLGVVHRSPRTGESTRRDWMKNIDNFPIKFEKCFETSFYSKVASNVQENLAKFLDGSFNFSPDPENAIKTRKAKNSVAINTAEGFPILLACEQYSRSVFDSYMPRAIAPKHKWKWDNVETEKALLSADQIKRDSHTNNCIITLVSSLDIWTQLCMRRKFEFKYGAKPMEKKTEKQNIIGKELKDILESREIPSSPQVVKYRGVPEVSSRKEDFPAWLGLRRAVSRLPALEATSATASVSTSAPAPAVLSGEWVRPRCYVCCACGAQSHDSRTLKLHISTKHPNAQVQHYEIVGEQLLKADILQHLYVPPNQVTNRTRPPRGIRECTKCQKSISLEDLHQHMLDCAGDTPAVRRRHCRYRPFGVRRRRPRLPDNTVRKEMRRGGPRSRRPNKIIRSRAKIRSEVGDAETIRKMLADLPPKRHRVIVNPTHKMPRQRGLLNKQRNKMMRKRPTEPNSSAPNRSSGKSGAGAGVDASSSRDPDHPPNKTSAQDDEDDEDDKPLKPKAQRSLNQRAIKNELTRNAALRRRSIRVRQKNIIMQPEQNSNANIQEPLDNTLTERVDVNKSAYNTRENAGRSQERSNNRAYQRNDGNRDGGYDTRENSNRAGPNNNRDHWEDRHPPPGPGSSRPNRNNDDNNAEATGQSTPLKHSIARLTANSETHDKSVQFHHCFLVQQECNNTDQHAPSDPITLFESEAVASKLDKPPINNSEKSQYDLNSSQKNKLNKPKKGLNDCIAMLKNKLVEPSAATGHVSVQCGSDDPIGPIHLTQPPPISHEAMMVSPGSDHQSNTPLPLNNPNKGQLQESFDITQNKAEKRPTPHYDQKSFAIPARPRPDQRRHSTEQKRASPKSPRLNTWWEQAPAIMPNITLERRRTSSSSSEKRSTYPRSVKAAPRRKSMTPGDLYEPTLPFCTMVDLTRVMTMGSEYFNVKDPPKPRTRSSNRNTRSRAQAQAQAQSTLDNAYIKSLTSAQLLNMKASFDTAAADEFTRQAYTNRLYSERGGGIPHTSSMSYEQAVRQEMERIPSIHNIPYEQKIDEMPPVNTLAYDQAVEKMISMHSHPYDRKVEKIPTMHSLSYDRHIDKSPIIHTLPYDQTVEKIAQLQNIPHDHHPPYDQRIDETQPRPGMNHNLRICQTSTTHTIGYDHIEKMPSAHDTPYEQTFEKMPVTPELSYQNDEKMDDMHNCCYEQTMMSGYPDSQMSTQTHEDMSINSDAYQNMHSDMNIYSDTRIMPDIPPAHGMTDVRSETTPNSPLDLSGTNMDGRPIDLSVKTYPDSPNEGYDLDTPSNLSITEDSLSTIKSDDFQCQSTDLSVTAKEKSMEKRDNMQYTSTQTKKKSMTRSGHLLVSALKENEAQNTTEKMMPKTDFIKVKAIDSLQSTNSMENMTAQNLAVTKNSLCDPPLIESVKRSEENNARSYENAAKSSHYESMDLSQRLVAKNTYSASSTANDSIAMTSQSLMQKTASPHSSYEYESTAPAYTVANSVAKDNSNFTTTAGTVTSATAARAPESKVATQNMLNIEITEFGSVVGAGDSKNHDKIELRENVQGTDVATIDAEIAKKIAMLPRELVEIIGTMPIGHRNQLLNVLPQYVATTMASPLSLPDTGDTHSLTMNRNKTEDQTGSIDNHDAAVNIIQQERNVEKSVKHQSKSMVHDKISSTALTPSPPAAETMQCLMSDHLPQQAITDAGKYAKLPESVANDTNQYEIPVISGEFMNTPVCIRNFAKERTSSQIKDKMEEVEDMSHSKKMACTNKIPAPTRLVNIDKSIRPKSYNEQTASLRAVRIRAQTDRQKEVLPVRTEDINHIRKVQPEGVPKLAIAEKKVNLEKSPELVVVEENKVYSEKKTKFATSENNQVQPEEGQSLEIVEKHKVQPEKSSKLAITKENKVQSENATKLAISENNKVRSEKVTKVTITEKKKGQTEKVTKLTITEKNKVQPEKVTKLTVRDKSKVQPEIVSKLENSEKNEVQLEEVTKLAVGENNKIQHEEVTKFVQNNKVQPELVSKLSEENMVNTLKSVVIQQAEISSTCVANMETVDANTKPCEKRLCVQEACNKHREPPIQDPALINSTNIVPDIILSTGGILSTGVSKITSKNELISETCNKNDSNANTIANIADELKDSSNEQVSVADGNSNTVNACPSAVQDSKETISENSINDDQHKFLDSKEKDVTLEEADSEDDISLAVIVKLKQGESSLESNRHSLKKKKKGKKVKQSTVRAHASTKIKVSAECEQISCEIKSDHVKSKGNPSSDCSIDVKLASDQEITKPVEPVPCANSDNKISSAKKGKGKKSNNSRKFSFKSPPRSTEESVTSNDQKPIQEPITEDDLKTNSKGKLAKSSLSNIVNPNTEDDKQVKPNLLMCTTSENLENYTLDFIDNVQKSAVPLRRSRRGKSLFIDSTEADIALSLNADSEADHKLPVTKKQLIFSKLLLDEEKHYKPSAGNEALTDVSTVDSVNENKVLGYEQKASDDLNSKKVCSLNDDVAQIDKQTKRKKTISAQKNKRKKSDESLPLETSSISSELSETTCSSETTHIQKNLEDYKNTGVSNNDEISDQTHPSVVKRKQFVDSANGSSAKKSKLSPKSKQIQNDNDTVENKITSEKNLDISSKVRSTTCYAMPKAARRTRSKSVIVKSSAAVEYDPYDIDLDDMNECEPLIKTFKSSSNRSKLKSIKVKVPKKVSKHMDNKSSAIISGYCITDNSENIREICAQNNSTDPVKTDVLATAEQIEIKYENSDITLQKSPKKENCSDSDDSSKSDIPLNKYIEGKVKKRLANNKNDSRKKIKSNKKKCGKSRETIETCSNSENIGSENETQEQLRSEQFMESFGFFSKRQPRKSNLLASKKIAETFHSANESDDKCLQRKTKKKKCGESKSSEETSPLSASNSSKKLPKRGRKKKSIPLPKTKPEDLHCTACKKMFARIDNLMRHRLTYIHASKLTYLELKLQTKFVPGLPNYCIAFKEQMEKYRLLTEAQRGRRRPRIKLPSLQVILADAYEAVRQEELALRGLSTDQALFIDCCELLKESTAVAGAPKKDVGATATPKGKRCYGQCTSLIHASCNSSADKNSKSEGDDKTGKTEGDDKTSKIEGDDKTDKSEDDEKSGKSEGDDKSGKSEVDDKCGKSEGGDQTSKIEGGYQTGKIEGDNKTSTSEGDDKSGKSEVDVDSITARKILESDEVRNLENDLISSFKEAACARSRNNECQPGKSNILETVHCESIETVRSQNEQKHTFNPFDNLIRERIETVTSNNYQAPSFDPLENMHRGRIETVTSLLNYQELSLDPLKNLRRERIETVTSNDYQEPNVESLENVRPERIETVRCKNYQNSNLDPTDNLHQEGIESVTSNSYLEPSSEPLENVRRERMKTSKNHLGPGIDLLENLYRERNKTVKSKNHRESSVEPLENVCQGRTETAASKNYLELGIDLLKNLHRKKNETVTSKNYQELVPLENLHCGRNETVTSKTYQETSFDESLENETITSKNQEEPIFDPKSKDVVIPKAEPRQNKIRKSIEVKEKMYPDVENIDMFEDKFDKIKRKCRSQAAAAKQSNSATFVEPTSGQKSETEDSRKKKKILNKIKKIKKIKKKSKKSYQNTVLTKGALKGFDPTSETDMFSMVPPNEHTKKKRKKRGKKKREKERSEYSGKYGSEDRAKDSGSNKKVDVYEFEDNEEAELFELRPSTLMERFKSKFKNKPSTPKRESVPVDADDSGESGSDGDDFVYMSDDYVASDDETENSLMSEIGNVKNKREKSDKSVTPPKRKDVTEKTAVMGKIFKHNAVRTEKKNAKCVETANPQSNLDQLFDSLLKEAPVDEIESDKNERDIVSSQNEESLSQSSSEPPMKRCLSPEIYNHPTPKKDIKPRLVVSAITKSGGIYGMDCMPSTSKQADEMDMLNDFNSSSQTDSEAFLPKKHDESMKYDFDGGDDDIPKQFSLSLNSKKKSRKDKPLPFESPVASSPDRGLTRSIFDATGVALQRARRKCTVGKQNILAETWSSESESEVGNARPNSAESVAHHSHRKKKIRKGQSGGRRGKKPVSNKKHDVSRVSSCNRIASDSGGAGGAGGAGSSGCQTEVDKGGVYEWAAEPDDDSAEGSVEQQDREHEQHGWIVGGSHKKLVTMLAHAKGRHRNDDHDTLQE